MQRKRRWKDENPNHWLYFTRNFNRCFPYINNSLFIFHSHPLPWSFNDMDEILQSSFLLPEKGRGHSWGAFTSITKHLTGVTPTRIELGWEREVVPRHSESNPQEDRSCLCNKTVKVCLTLFLIQTTKAGLHKPPNSWYFKLKVLDESLQWELVLCSQEIKGSRGNISVMLPLPTVANSASRHKLLDCSPTSREWQQGLGLEDRLLLPLWWWCEMYKQRHVFLIAGAQKQTKKTSRYSLYLCWGSKQSLAKTVVQMPLKIDHHTVTECFRLEGTFGGHLV